MIGCTFSDNMYSLNISGTSTAEQITGNTILGQRDYQYSFVLYAVLFFGILYAIEKVMGIRFFDFF